MASPLPDANTGTAVGDNSSSGTILRTTDGGATWNPQTSGTTFALNAVSFTDVNNGWAVGNNGTIRHTTNGGAGMDRTDERNDNNLFCVSFSDANNGAAAGYLGTVLNTTNGGTTWTKQVSRTSNDINGIFCNNAATATLVADAGGILHTTSGGTVLGVVENHGQEIPPAFSLSQNYPNPFNPATEIRFQIADYRSVTLKIYDLLGRELTQHFVNEAKQAGTYAVTWDAQGFPSGVYF